MQCGLWIPIRQFIQYVLLYLGLNVGALKFWDSSAILQYCGLGGGGKAITIFWPFGLRPGVMVVVKNF